MGTTQSGRATKRNMCKHVMFAYIQCVMFAYIQCVMFAYIQCAKGH